MGKFKRYIYQGKEYSAKELSVLAGVTPATFIQRITRYAWSVEDAVKGTCSNFSVAQAKRGSKKRKLKMYAKCGGRCNAK